MLSEAARATAMTSEGDEQADVAVPGSGSSRKRAEDAVACAAWLKAMGVKELRYVGPFGDHGIGAGDRVRVRAGARVYSTMPSVPKQGKLTVRAKDVRVARVSAGVVEREGDGFVVRNPLVTWAGKGGYWCWCDANSVERVGRREKKWLGVVGAIADQAGSHISARGSLK